MFQNIKNCQKYHFYATYYGELSEAWQVPPDSSHTFLLKTDVMHPLAANDDYGDII